MDVVDLETYSLLSQISNKLEPRADIDFSVYFHTEEAREPSGNENNEINCYSGGQYCFYSEGLHPLL